LLGGIKERRRRCDNAASAILFGSMKLKIVIILGIGRGERESGRAGNEDGFALCTLIRIKR
ncbi:MAG: hypothetical protein K2H15_08845, partial [Muribaculaceae bacterium]|nr:hypothetical protein [Muribaculaceae bacterium]